MHCLSLSLPPPLFLTKDFGRGGVGCEGEGVVSLLVPLLVLKFSRRKPSESLRFHFFILLSFPLRVTGGDAGPMGEGGARVIMYHRHIQVKPVCHWLG